MVSSKGPGFAGILQSLRRLERVSARNAFAKMRACAAFPDYSTNVVCDYRPERINAAREKRLS
jgi:hypothetical protein